MNNYVERIPVARLNSLISGQGIEQARNWGENDRRITI